MTDRKMSVDVHATEGLGGGLKQEWLSGEDGDDVDFILCSGAGFGNPHLELRVTVDGVTVREHIDVRELVPHWVDHIVYQVRFRDKENADV